MIGRWFIIGWGIAFLMVGAYGLGLAQGVDLEHPRAARRKLRRLRVVAGAMMVLGLVMAFAAPFIGPEL